MLYTIRLQRLIVLKNLSLLQRQGSEGTPHHLQMTSKFTIIMSDYTIFPSHSSIQTKCTVVPPAKYELPFLKSNLTSLRDDLFLQRVAYVYTVHYIYTMYMKYGTRMEKYCSNRM